MRKNHLLRKRIFSIIMTLIMVVSLIPANVFADSNAGDVDDAANSTTHSHCVCGKTTHQDIGSHNQEDKRTFTAWDPSEHLDSNGKPTLPTVEGAYYLTDNVTLTDSWQLTGGGVTLCLNGHTVNVEGRATIKVKGGGKLILTDCADQQGTIQGSGQPGIEITGSKDTTSDTIYPASFMLYGGTLTGFSIAVKVGDMYSEGKSSFTMYGGKITGNNAGSKEGSGAAVSGLAKSTHVGDTLPSSIITMHGGELFGNTGEAGGGVYIGDNCTFNMKGGKISNNEAKGRDVSDSSVAGAILVRNGGGGVYLDSWGKFYMTGGEISGNKASGVGGGVCVMSYVTSYAVSITGGKITGNESTDNSGGGIYGGPAKLIIQNTEISNNKCAGNGGGIFTTQPLTLESVQITGNTASTNGGYEGGGVKIGGDSKNFKGEDALTVSGNTSISDNSPNNYYVNQSYLLPVKVSGALDANARIGICLNKDTATDVSNDKFLPTTTSDSVVATAESGVTLDFKNFTADYRYYVVRDNSSDTSKVEFGLCDHDVSEGSDTCSKCNTKFVAVLEPKDEGANKEYFRDLNDVEIDNKTGTLKLFHDVTFSKAISIYRSTLTLDLNGHTIEKAKGVLSPIKLGSPNSKDYRSVLTVIDSKKETKDSKLDVEFTVTAGSTLNLYDGTNAQSYQGTVGSVKLTRTGKLVSCGGRIEELWLYRTDTPSDRWEGLKLWQDNDQCCIIGTIRYSESDALYVNDVLAQTNPGCTLYGTKDGKKTAVTGNYVQITSDGIAGGYTDLYLQAHEHRPKSESELKCEKCEEALVAEIRATKDGETKTAYFTKDSNDTTRWNNGQDEAAAQLADWVKAGYTDAKLIPHGDLQGTMNLTCKMTLEGTEYDIGYVNVKDSAEVTFKGGTYKDSISVRGSATFENGTYYGKITAGSGTATFESGTFNSVAVTGGTAIVKNNATFAATNEFARNAENTIEVTDGTLNVEGGTIGSKVTIEQKGSLTISGGEFKNTVTIKSNTSGTCVISGGTFDGTVNVWLKTSSVGTCAISGGTFAKLEAGSNSGNLSALLANGYNFYDKSTVVNGEVNMLENVTVKSEHTHSFDSNTGACSECGKQMAASVTVGEGQPAYYATREEAVSALNAADGAKTLKLFQSRKGNNYKVEGHTLTNGPVTLDLNGQGLDSVTFIAKGITLTLKSEKTGGYVSAVQASGTGSKIVANKEDINDDGYVTVNTISAQECGQLELSAGTFYDLYVVNDGSSASLSGGIYQPLSYDYGGGPEDEYGSSGKYVSTYDLLANGYGYQKKQNDGSFAWVTDARIIKTSRSTYKVAEIGASFEKIYPDNEANFTGDTYLIKLGKNETTYTLKLTAVSNPASQVSYLWQSGRADGGWINRPQNSDTDYEVNSDNGTITIKNLNPGTYRYRVQYTLKDSDGKDALAGFSDPLTVVVTKHEHSWAYTAKGAIIKAECTEENCYLENSNGGSVTINAPEHTVCGDDKSAEAKVTPSSDWLGGDVSEINVTYTKNGTTLSAAPTDLGTYIASITFTNSDDSKATANVEYTIKGKNPTEDLFELIDPNLTYNASNQIDVIKSAVKLKAEYQGKVGTVTVTVMKNGQSVQEATNAGTYQVYVSCEDGTEYAAARENIFVGTVDIAKADATCTVPTAKGLTYNGKGQTLVSGGTATGGTMMYSTKENGEYEEGIPTGKAAGNYTVWYKVIGDDNHNDTTPKSVSVTIGRKVITGAKITLGAALEYNGEEQTQSITSVKADGLDVTYDVSGNTGKDVKEYTLTVNGTGNFTGTTTAKWNIARKDITNAVITLEDSKLTYTGSPQRQEIKSVKVGEMDVTYEVKDDSDTGTNANEYQLTITGTGNFTGTATKKFAIAKAKINVTGFEIEPKTYDGTKDAVVKSVSFEGLVNKETLTLGTDFTATAEFDKANAGTQTATVTAELTGKEHAQNYELVTAINSKSFDIAKADAQNVTKEVTAEVTYGDNAKKTASVANVNMPANAGKITYTKGNTNAIDKVKEWNVDANGKVTFEISGADAGNTITLPVRISSNNYNDVTVNVLITITKAQSTITITNAAALNREYDEKALAAQHDNNGDGAVTTEYFNNEGKSLGANAPTKAGTYKVVVTQKEGANYKGSEAEATFTIAPAAVTTTDTPTQDTVYAGTEVSKVTFKEKKVTVAFNNGTRELAGTWSVATQDGADKFDKAGKYTCTATFTPNDKNFAPITIGYIEITVTNRPSGGGGGAVIPTTEVVTKDKTTTSPGDVKTETKTGTDGNKETISKVTVSDDNQKEIIKQVKDNKSEEIIINVSEKDIADGASLEINLDKEFIDSIVNDTDAKLTIKTPAGDRTFTKEELKELSEASTGDTITIDPTDDDSDKAEKIAKAKELTAGLGLTARSGKTAKGNVNVVLKNSTMTKDSIKELEELGFTVKYRFYRSTKKSSGYKSMVTKNTASYTNTTGKKGTKYYYKVRVMVYDADGNLVAKTDLKQCKYAARTWSK